MYVCKNHPIFAVKGVNFFGLESEYVTSGSDCGNVFLWDKHSEKIVQYMDGDHEGVVNCLEAHPHIPILATSGLDHDVKVFSPTASHPTTLEGLSQVLKGGFSQVLGGGGGGGQLISARYWWKGATQVLVEGGQLISARY